MSKYTMYYTDRQQMFRELALCWVQHTKTLKLTEDQHKGMALFFRSIARRFGLVKEFREIGVI